MFEFNRNCGFDQWFRLGCYQAYAHVINGTSANDVLVGTKSNDLILGNGGNDTITSMEETEQTSALIPLGINSKVKCES